MLKQYNWHHSFKAIYHAALSQYQQGNRDLGTYFNEGDVAYLGSIGCKPIEIYDFVEDFPDIEWETVLLITSVRREYFLSAHGTTSEDLVDVEEFPAKNTEVDGIPWLPRLITKARAKLRGRLPKELMYCCGGDRAFFKKYDIHPADFLRVVWNAGDDQRQIVESVKSRAVET